MEDLIDDEFLERVSHGPLFRDNVRKIQAHVDRTRDITHRMLGFARRMEPHQDTFNANDVAAEALSFIEREASFRQVELVREFEADLPMIKSDRAQLQQVFLNLLNNALDAVAEGGRITVASRADHDVLEVSIKDNGAGIDKEHPGPHLRPVLHNQGARRRQRARLVYLPHHHEGARGLADL